VVAVQTESPGPVDNPLTQARWSVRCDWGLTGARMAADPQGAVVVVDVLAFTTAVAIAVGRGSVVYPSPATRRRPTAMPKLSPVPAARP
jgi:hypothetical protein